nr:ribosomal protein L34 [Porphyrostromium japonicum]
MTKRTLRGTNHKRVKISGFRSRMSTPTGRRVLRLRRKKGRAKLSVSS